MPIKAFCHYDHNLRQFNCSGGTWSPRYHCLQYPVPNSENEAWTCINLGMPTESSEPGTCDAAKDALSIIDIMRSKVPPRLGMTFVDLIAMLEETINYCNDSRHINPK